MIDFFGDRVLRCPILDAVKYGLALQGIWKKTIHLAVCDKQGRIQNQRRSPGPQRHNRETPIDGNAWRSQGFLESGLCDTGHLNQTHKKPR